MKLRKLLYGYLIYEHRCLTEASKRLGISVRMASYHVSVMMKEGAIEKLGGTISTSWRPGPNHALYSIPPGEIVSGMPYGMVEIDQNVTPTKLTVPDEKYVDRAWFSVEIVKQAEDDVEWWDKKWESSGTIFRKKAIFLEHKKKVTFTSFNDKAGRIQIEPFYIPNAIAHEAPDIAYDLAQKSLQELVRLTGMGFGLILPYEGAQKLTVEKPLPLLEGTKPGVVKIKGDETYVDGTPVPSLASSNMEYVKADAQMPYRVLNLEKGFVGLKQDLDKINAHLDNNDITMSEIVKTMDRLATGEAELTGQVKKLVETLTDLVKGPKDLKMKEMDELDREAYR